MKKAEKGTTVSDKKAAEIAKNKEISDKWKAEQLKKQSGSFPNTVLNRMSENREAEMAKRRAKGLPAGKSKSTVPTKRNDGLADYMKTVKGESFKIKEKNSSTIKPETAVPEKPKEAAVTVTSAPKKPGIRMTASNLPSKISKDANLQKSKPVDVSYKPTASSPKKKTKAELVDSGKTKRGTMKVNAQVKIAAIRKKERAASQKAERVENKAGRVAKRTAIKAIRKGK